MRVTSLAAPAYGGSVFLVSAGGLILEIVAGRLIAPYVGMSLYTWTAIIAVVLGGLSIGHWIGGSLAQRQRNPRWRQRRVAEALLAGCAASLLVFPLLRGLSGVVLGLQFSPLAAIALLVAAVFLAPSLCIGVVSPLLTMLAADALPEKAGRTVGRMYALGAAGSIVGTVLAGFLFISWIGSTGTVVAVAGLYGGLGLVFAGLARAPLVAAVLGAGIAGAGVWGVQAQAFRSPCQTESNYYCLRIEDFSPESGRPSQAMVIDHLAHSISDEGDPTLLYSPYLHFADEWLSRHPGVREPRAFFIGGGGYTLPRAWLNRYGGAQLTVAEVDPAVSLLAQQRMWLRAGPGLRIVHDDARRALQVLPPVPTFDVVFGDAFHDVTIPPHLVTREFHREVAARLMPRGAYMVNVIEDGRDPTFLFALVNTLQQEFPAVEVWLDADAVRQGGRVTFIVLAARQETGAGNMSAASGLRRTWLRWPSADLAARVAQARVPLLTDDFAPVDRLMQHLLLHADPTVR